MFIVLKKRQMAVFCTVFAIIAGVFLTKNISGKFLMQETSNTDWGLGYTEQGAPPTGNATPEELSPYNAHFLGDTDKKVIYLTFDAGYENGVTPKILDTLKKHNAKATFFLVGNFIKTKPELVKRMVNEGHNVGNHTMTHPDMSKISDMESFKAELNGLEALFYNATGKELQKLYRPPQGKFSFENLKMANELGYKTFFWSLAYVDWIEDNQPTKEEAFSKLIPRIHNGAIVLLHSTSKTNGEILDELLSRWEQMGYSFGDLSTL